MPASLQGKTVAVLATDGFEQVELLEPRKALEAAGAKVEVVSPKAGEIQGFKHFDKGETVRVDKPLSQADARDYDALMMPGGAHNPDHLRILPEVHQFVRGFFEAGKPVAAICHAPWVLIDSGVAEGRMLTSYKTIRQDLRNAGARVVDQEVVVDGNLITSRQPSDIPAFNARMIEAFSQGARPELGRSAQERPDQQPTLM
jgi:protease I